MNSKFVWKNLLKEQNSKKNKKHKLSEYGAKEMC